MKHKTILFLSISCLFWGCYSSKSNVEKQHLLENNQRPNVIFILTDDQRWDALGIAGNKIIQTPQIDTLATSGTYFKNAFSTTPICAASRASILTGLYERTHGYTFQKPKLRAPYAEMIYPKIFKDHGYHVGFFGKLGVVMNNPSQYFNESDFYDRGGQAEKPGYFYQKIYLLLISTKDLFVAPI